MPKVQKFGLVETFKKNEFATYIRRLISIPILPESLLPEFVLKGSRACPKLRDWNLI